MVLHLEKRNEHVIRITLAFNPLSFAQPDQHGHSVHLSHHSIMNAHETMPMMIRIVYPQYHPSSALLILCSVGHVWHRFCVTYPMSFYVRNIVRSCILSVPFLLTHVPFIEATVFYASKWHTNIAMFRPYDALGIFNVNNFGELSQFYATYGKRGNESQGRIENLCICCFISK